MSYRVQLAPGARRQLHRLPAKAAFAVVEFLDGPLPEDPYRVGKKLRDDPKERYTARVGNYRILYRVHEAVQVVSVTRVAHRAGAYRP